MLEIDPETGIPMPLSGIWERRGSICQLCGVTRSRNGKGLQLHHLDWDHCHNDESNLLIVCQECHAHLHQVPYPIDPSFTWGQRQFDIIN